MTENSTRKEQVFSNKVKKMVWQKAPELIGHPPEIWRKDENSKPMNWDEYLNPKCNNGWKITYIKPLEEGGTDDISNLRAVNLHHQSN